MVHIVFIKHVASDLSLNHLDAFTVDFIKLGPLVELPVRAEVNSAPWLVQTLDILGEQEGKSLASDFPRPDLFDRRVVEDLSAKEEHILLEFFA